ncbi:MAG: ABC transporter substrate-binding protein [Oscillospiraceae bacterium]|nr:ABC transporter substrate-binding protein [Oscillospiraceae bacterium]
MKTAKKVLALLMLLALLGGILAGCGSKPQQTEPAQNQAAVQQDKTLVVGTLNFDGKFSPFFYTNAYENEVLSLVHVDLLGTDREGAVVLEGIRGEIRPYNGTDYVYTGIADCAVTENPDGTVYYDITLKEGVKFSDGTEMNIDDVIFSLYVPLDPSYDGIMTLYSLPIEGLAEYRENAEVPSITGIQRLGDYSLRIVMTEFSATAIYQLSTAVVPMHYYGDEDLYDYENNMFGFPKGDLSGVKSVTTQPMGAGPYRFVSYAGGIVTLEANENYWKGTPKTRYIQFREGQDADKVPGVAAGTIDITSPTYSVEMAKAIANYNGGTLSGDVISASMVDNLGYGYIGFNANRVKVGQDGGSEASRNLRKAIATVISVYRDVAVDSYYGEFANVINYPISDTSWAAPRVTDVGYRMAFSVGPEGNSLYTPDMTPEERYDAALEGALEFFEAAGYTQEDDVLTAAPEGGKLSYEVLVGAGGNGDHPTFMALTQAAAALKEIGFQLIVTDLSNFSELTNAVNAGAAEMFAMAWNASADPDMYQIYHSQGGSNEKAYHIKDAQLDEMILLARQSADQTYRKTLYKACLDIINDWAVEIPMYQRQNVIIFSTRRVNMDTVTPDITPFWGWANDIELLEMR